ncbi:NAD(P)-dependent oxidoreductase [Longispora albida]|uniref:NAD(P)-dependent oxidoreductase n=1 Tax=Longispora albida TaxID=203523 RepID=UPI00036D2E8F|nr:NAD(P)H-binding protein [Longispora albida]
MTDTKKQIVVFGAGGRAGRAIVAEAASRGHQVTAVVRDPARHAGLAAAGVTVRAGDVADPAAAAGHDIAVNAAADLAADPGTFFPAAAKALASSTVERVVSVGLASVLADATGTLLMDTPGYPQEYRGFYLGHAAGTAALAASGAEWVVLSPAGDFDHAGGRTGRYTITAGDAGSRVSYPDFAVAVLDEIERPAHSRTHIGVGG